MQLLSLTLAAFLINFVGILKYCRNETKYPFYGNRMLVSRILCPNYFG